MFFSINRTAQENFTQHWKLGNFTVSTDAGWDSVRLSNYTVVFKGYVDDAKLVDVLEKVIVSPEPSLTGNFCVLAYNHNSELLEIKSDVYRSFPIYYGHEIVTNLVPQTQTAWTNNCVTVDSSFNIDVKRFALLKNFSETHSSIDDIDRLIANKVQSWANHNTKPVKVFLSGGVDTLLVFSYIKRFNIPYEHVWGLYVDYDDFWLANSSDITNHWGYTQIHHWTTPSVLASGAPGDEFTLRNPETSNLYLLHHGTSILKEMQKTPDCLHREYYSKKKHIDAFRQQESNYKSCRSLTELSWTVCNNAINDWQHWHIGQTLTWTPLRDLELLKLFLQLPFELARGQILDSTVSKELIERNSPGLTSVISDQKNSGNYMRNLRLLQK